MLSGAFGTRTYVREALLKGADLSKAEFFRAKLTAADLSMPFKVLKGLQNP